MAVTQQPAGSDRETAASATSDPSPPHEVRRVTLSTYIGNTIGYHDVILYCSAVAG